MTHENKHTQGPWKTYTAAKSYLLKNGFQEIKHLVWQIDEITFRLTWNVVRKGYNRHDVCEYKIVKVQNV